MLDVILLNNSSIREIYTLNKKNNTYERISEPIQLNSKREYYVNKLASENELERLIVLKQKEKLLKEEIEKLTCDVSSDAEIALDGTDYSVYEYHSNNGSIIVNSSTSIDINRPGQMKDFINDDKGELISEEIVYKPKQTLKNILKIINNKEYICERKTDFINKFGKKFPNPNSLSPKEIEKKLKKKYDSNVRLFMNTFEVSSDIAEMVAKEYTLVCNYEEMIKFLNLCGVNILSTEEKELNKYLVDLTSYVTVDTKYSVTIKNT